MSVTLLSEFIIEGQVSPGGAAITPVTVGVWSDGTVRYTADDREFVVNDVDALKIFNDALTGTGGIGNTIPSTSLNFGHGT